MQVGSSKHNGLDSIETQCKNKTQYQVRITLSTLWFDIKSISSKNNTCGSILT